MASKGPCLILHIGFFLPVKLPLLHNLFGIIFGKPYVQKKTPYLEI